MHYSLPFLGDSIVKVRRFVLLVALAGWQGDKDSRDMGLSTHYEQNLVALIKQLRVQYNGTAPAHAAEPAEPAQQPRCQSFAV
jgi:hypothetical protein